MFSLNKKGEYCDVYRKPNQTKESQWSFRNMFNKDQPTKNETLQFLEITQEDLT